MKHAVAASVLAGALILVAAAPSDAGGRVIIGGPVFYWGAPYPYYYPYPYYGYGPYYNPYEEAEKRAMAQVRLTTEPALVSGCSRLGVVTDDSVRDMRRKIVRAGGNAAIVSFPVDNLKMMQGDVYRCTTTAKAPAAGSATESSTTPPPPPAGSPPPPPAGYSR
jgi:hypothetical protein